MATSRWRRSERSVHSGDRAFSVSPSSLRMARSVSAAAVVASGIWAGSASRSLTCLTMPNGMRSEPASRSRIESPELPSVGHAPSSSSSSVGIGSSGASRSKSRNSSDSCTPPSPSVIVWCIFSIRAARPPSRPSTITNCHSGRVRSNGSAVISVARSSSWRSVPGLGSAMRRTWWSRSKSGSSTQTGALTLPGEVCTRWRSRGIRIAVRSMRRRSRSKFGLRSRIVTLANVDDR